MIQSSIDWMFYNILRLDDNSKIVQSLNYFIYDSIKIMLLLFFMIAIIGFLRTYLPQKKVKSWLNNRVPIVGNFAASFFGAITPFCSCSSIPIFISFLEAGVPLGLAFSFLITSPIVNEYLVVLMFGFFGWKITLAYVLSGILIGVISGAILGNMKLEKYIEKDLISKNIRIKNIKYSNIKQRIRFGLNEANSIVKKLWFWVLIGVAVGAIIHNFIPESAVHYILGKGGIFTVILAVLIGVPLYGNCAAIVPIAVALFDKGFPIGTALAFMMAVSALSFPEAIILRRAMKLKLIAIFFGTVTLAIIITGYLFNYLQGFLL
jgi:uncharacterized protein